MLKQLLKLKLVVGLSAAIAFDTILQLTWKSAVLDTPGDSSFMETLGAVFGSPLLIAVIVIMACQFFNWLMVLGEADLSYAKPVASLSYASVPVFSVLLLNEAFDAVEIAGVVLVIAGVWFISRTKPLSQSGDPEIP
jgi:drug/metabolite transporter (DMT)-like permease